MLLNRLQVLALLALAAPTSSALAQPADAPPPASTPLAKPAELPLLLLSKDEVRALSGGKSGLVLKMEDATAGEIAYALREQAGLDVQPSVLLRDDQDKAPRFSVEARGESFWAAVSAWNRGARALSITNGDADRSRWKLQEGAAGFRGVAARLEGPCLLLAQEAELHISRSLQLGVRPDDPDAGVGAQAQGGLVLKFSAQFDPWLQARLYGLIAEVEPAQDDQGREVKAGANGMTGIGVDFGHPYFYYSLDAPQEGARSLRLLKGTMRLAVVTRSEKWEIDMATTPQAARTFQGEGMEVTVRFDGLRPKAEGTTALFQMSRKALGAPRVFKARPGFRSLAGLDFFSAFPRSVLALNARGEPIRVSGTGGTSGPDSIDIQLAIGQSFGVVDEKQKQKATPVKLIADVPLAWRELQIAFEFNNLPLP